MSMSVGKIYLQARRREMLIAEDQTWVHRKETGNESFVA